MAKRKKKTVRRSEPPSEIRIGVREVVVITCIAAVLVAAGWWMAARGGVGSERSAVAGLPAETDSERATGADGGTSASVGAASSGDRAPASAPDGGAGGELTRPVFEPGTWMTAEGDPAIGLAAAPVTIVAYTDFQCANCREFATQIVPWIRETWLRRGLVRVIHRDFAVLGAESLRAAEAAHCAGDEGRFWSYYEALFQRQSGQNLGVFSDEALLGFAEELGLDLPAFRGCLEGGAQREKVDASTQQGHKLGFEGTPTFVINGRTIAGAVTQESWQELFEAYESEILRATEDAP